MVALLWGAPSQAQRVTAHLRQTPAWIVIEDLRKQTGAPIFHNFRGGMEPSPDIDLAVEDVPLRVALRQIADQLGCYVQRRYDWYWVREGPDPWEPCPMVTLGPYRLRLHQMSVGEDASLHVTGRNAVRVHGNPRRLRIGFSIEADEDLDMARVLGIAADARAIDNTAQQLVPASDQPFQARAPWSHDSDWREAVRCSVAFMPPELHATSLRVVEGDLLVHTQAQAIQFELSLEADDQPHSIEGYRLRLVEFAAAPEGGYTVKAELSAPELDLPTNPLELWRRAWLVSQRGRRIWPSSAPRERFGTGQPPDSLELSWQFRRSTMETPNSLLVRLITTSGPTERLHFRFEDLLLPTWAD